MWYLAIGLDRSYFSTEYCYEFLLHTRFISNYLSRRIRTRRFTTDGTFNMISIRLGPLQLRSCETVYPDVLRVSLGLDQKKYEQIKRTQDCEFYLEMFEEGFREASKCKEIPLQTLLDLIDEFRKDGCKNEWLHKRRQFKEKDIEVALNCNFTTWDFKLTATIKCLSTKMELCAGVLMRTDSDEICFDKEFKDILIDDETILITDFLDRPRYAIRLDKALAGKFDFERLPE